MNILHLLPKKNFFEKIGRKSPPPPSFWKVVIFGHFFYLGLRTGDFGGKQTKTKFFYNTSHNHVCLPKKILCTHLKYLKKDLKGSINPGEDLLAFGTQKPENFNDKNRIYLAFWCVFKDIEHNFHEFVCFKKFFFEFVCFPRFQNSINDLRKHPNLAKNRKFLPKSSKNNKCWFLWQFLRQIFRYDPKIHCLWIFWL